MSDRSKLTSFLNEAIHWTWADFCRAENDARYTGFQSTVFALIRSCAESKLGAIKLAIDRIDGKVETPIEIIYPKIYFVYPYAKELEGGEQPKKVSDSKELAKLEAPEPEAEPKLETEEERKEKLATATLRETLEAMLEAPRPVVPLLLNRKKEIEKIVADDGEVGDSPLVKSIIAANLIHLAVDKNKFEAITEIFDQIDGKLVETMRVMGEDIYIEQYASVAPRGAEMVDGVYMLENKAISSLWEEKLKAKQKKR